MHAARTTLLHASCIAIGEAAVLLRGPSGCGKSDLALRMIDGGAALVADDMVAVTRTAGGALLAAPPAPLAGLLEVRGIGPMRLPHQARAVLHLVADLMPAAEIERVPLPAMAEILDCPLPLLRLDPWAASATARLRLALAHPRQLAGAHAMRVAAP